MARERNPIAGFRHIWTACLPSQGPWRWRKKWRKLNGVYKPYCQFALADPSHPQPRRISQDRVPSLRQTLTWLNLASSGVVSETLTSWEVDAQPSRKKSNFLRQWLLMWCEIYKPSSQVLVRFLKEWVIFLQK